jgi:hypothetical protein
MLTLEFRRLTTVAVALLLSVLSSNAQVPAIATVASIFSGLNGVVKQLENSGHSLMDHGDAIAGRQQLLLAATLRSTIEQTEKACNDILDKAFDNVDAQRQGAIRDLRDLVRRADDIRGKTVADAQNLIYLTAGQANSILGRLPFVKHTPMYFGASTKDMLVAVDKAGPDLELLGFYLTDSTLPKGAYPALKINDTSIPAENIFGTFDRLKVKLPDALKQKIRSESSACDPPQSFTIELTVPWTNSPTLSKLSSYFINEAQFRDFVPSGAPIYDVAVLVNGKAIKDSVAVHPYRVSSGNSNWSCEETRPFSTNFTAPEPGSKILDANAEFGIGGRWENFNKTASYNGATATATGSVRGGNKELWNCPGGGGGQLFLFGTYQHPITVEEDFVFQNKAVLLTEASFAIPSEVVLREGTLKIELRRRSCDRIIDQAEFPITTTANRGGAQSSSNGLFSATYDKGQILITGSKILPQ